MSSFLKFTQSSVVTSRVQFQECVALLRKSFMPLGITQAHHGETPKVVRQREAAGSLW